MFWYWIGVIVAVALVLLCAYGWFHHRRRKAYYSLLAEQRKDICRTQQLSLRQRKVNGELAEEFRSRLLLRVEDFLSDETLQRLREEGLKNLPQGIRSYIPTHKKGRSFPYEKMHLSAPGALALYHSSQLQDWVSELIGQKVYPAADHDQSACSILFYDQPGDHINWHFDHNYYHGRQFTVLISLLNRAKNGGLSAGTLQHKLKDGQVNDVDTSENVLVIFEGAKVLHRVSPTVDGDLRIMLSMTYNTEPRISMFWELVRRFKDTAFHGLRVLWN